MTIQEQVLQIFADNYDRLVLIAKNNLRLQYQTENYEFDVVSHFLSGLIKTIENDKLKFETMIEDKKLVAYFCRSIYRNCVLTTGPYIRDLEKCRDQTSIESSNVIYKDNRRFIELLELIYSKVGSCNADMFLDYSMNNYTIHEIALKYGLSMFQAVNNIEKIKLKLKEVLK